MAKLPRSRPQGQTARRKQAKPRATRSGTPASAPRAESTPDRASFGPSEPAPGLPRLALDGAIEAAKLPVKVGATVTIRVLDAVIKGLRRQ